VSSDLLNSYARVRRGSTLTRPHVRVVIQRLGEGIPWFVGVSVRLREPGRVRTVGATKYGWIQARDSTRIWSGGGAAVSLGAARPSTSAEAVMRRWACLVRRLVLGSAAGWGRAAASGGQLLAHRAG
jgi:hypothetical protein